MVRFRKAACLPRRYEQLTSVAPGVYMLTLSTGWTPCSSFAALVRQVWSGSVCPLPSFSRGYPVGTHLKDGLQCVDRWGGDVASRFCCCFDIGCCCIGCVCHNRAHPIIRLQTTQSVFFEHLQTQRAAATSQKRGHSCHIHLFSIAGSHSC